MFTFRSVAEASACIDIFSFVHTPIDRVANLIVQYMLLTDDCCRYEHKSPTYTYT